MNRNDAAVYDACVLYPASLKDLLVELGVLAHRNKIFRPKWTNKIHEEWISNLLENRKDLTREKLERTRDLMEAQFEGMEANVAGYEHRIDALSLPDPDDRHVLAAAIECGASTIVTTNLKDFPDSSLKHCGVLAKHPDDFICEFLADNEELGEQLLEQAVRSIKKRLKKPAYTWNELFDHYEAAGLKRTVEYLKGIIPESEVLQDEARAKELAEQANEDELQRRLSERRKNRPR